MTHKGEHKCKKVGTRDVSAFDASGILGAPFPVVLHNGVTEKFCEECGEIIGHIVAKPKELIAATAILRAFKPMKLNGSEIKFLRKSLGLKAKELADEISIKAETLSRFENDKQPISEAAEKLLRAAVCLRHVDEARGLEVNIPGLFSMQISGVWPAENLAIHMSMELVPVQEEGGKPQDSLPELPKKWAHEKSCIAC